MTNMSLVTTFILTGLPHAPELDTLLCGIFLVTYVLTVVGNLLILLVITVDPRLHTPMYYLLSNLSFIDMWFSTVTVPKMLMTLVSPEGSPISFPSCVAQLYSFHFLGSTECFLYTVMAYDRFLAISYPLRYASMMSGRTCATLATTTWLSGSLHSAAQTTPTFRLPFCGPNQIQHYICDAPSILKLACADTSTVEMVIFVNIGMVALGCFFPDSAVLRVHRPFHPEDPHLRGEMESLPDLCLPLHCGPLLLWPWCFHLPETRLQGGCGQDCGCFLHCDDAPSEPCGLHPAEQGSEESSVEA